jgi:hypothetical protein
MGQGRSKKHEAVYGDGGYVTQRDKLIPKAEAFCDKKLRVKNPKDRGNDWTRLFFQTMDLMWMQQTMARKIEQCSAELLKLVGKEKKLKEALR